MYRGISPPAKSLKTYALYIAFFPHLVAGPIVISQELLPQFEKTLALIPENISYGAVRITWGLFKKMVIADRLGYIVGLTLNNPTGQSSSDIIIATFLFGIQIYCDFSGYCDIALGSARLLGIKLPENFHAPYLSSNPSEFWRRWHITLGRFVSRYIYIPLGGNRKGSIRTYLNLLVSMLLVGLWHGAAWNFVLWGVFHGICLTGDKMVQRFFHRDTTRNSGAFWIISLLFTQYLMFMGWIFFRVSDVDSIIYCLKKYIFIDFIILEPFIFIPIIIGAIVLLMIISQKFPLKETINRYMFTDFFEIIQKTNIKFQLTVIMILTFLIYLLAPELSPQFIYFQF